MEQWTATLFYMLIFMGILYFLMIRPQQKQQKKRMEMLSNLKVDDRVVFSGGIHGRITRFKDDFTLMVRIADKVEIEIDKAAVSYVPAQED
ncbi:MAG: preprotein translocase subunit YajC [Clostridia bacterium]|nr:preprotein translocase subunit YajC [Clostridia bacterium]